MEISDDGQNWDLVKAMTEKPSANPDDFLLETPVNARYVRLYIENVTPISLEPNDSLNQIGGYLSTSIYELEIYATDKQEENTLINLGVNNGTASANASEVDYFGPDKAIDGKKRNELGVDGKQSRWASSYGIGEKWLQVDFDKICIVNEIKLLWEKNNVTEYEILYSETGQKDDWKVAVTRGIPESIDETIILDNPVKAAAVRLNIKDFIAEDRDGIVDTWPTISVWEFEIYGNTTSEELPPPPLDANIALNKMATASDIEANTSFTPDKAVDGNKDSRWASDTQTGTERWWKVDFGHERDIKKIVTHWERRNTLDYEIQISNDDKEWTTIYHKEGIPDSKRQPVLLDEVESARYLKIKINDFQDADPDGGDKWHSVSIYEVEVYQTDVYSIDDAVTEIQAPVIGENDTKLELPVLLGDTEGKYVIEFMGADYEQIIDRDGTIYNPIVDTEVVVNYKVYEKENPENFSITPDITILVKGQFKNKGVNEKPLVSPELREWYGYSGDFVISNNSKIVINSTYSDKLIPIAEAFASDYTNITGRNISISTGSKPSNGDFYFTLGKDGIGLKKEGYLLNINDGITIEAENEIGAYWATRTILQILKQNITTIPKGVTRDYPKFEIRGFMLDVGRKPFDGEFIQDVVKNMSWYKLNDLQLHLNDNYIFLEDYTNSGKNPMTAYSGFRLESSLIGENGVKLTSEDTYYTKEWFGKLIDDSKIRGVNIVPEFDTPAHSLAFTKVRPDLRYGTNGRENDHLDIKNQMDEVVELVQGVFNEYLEGSNPTFRQDTIVHVGTDEFSGDGNAFMNYTNTMTKFIKDTGRTVRIWGSLTSAGVDNIVDPENVQMNLWLPGYANPKVMYDEGFKLINTLDASLYMVPDATYYHDYLDSESLYNNWNANNFSGFIMPIGSPQMLGAMFAVWNDMIDIRANGISQGDIYDRIKDAIPTMSEKLWGNANDKTYVQLKELVQKLGEAPNSNPRHEIKSKNKVAVKLPFDDLKDYSGNKYDGNLNNAEINENGKINGGLYLKGNKSYFELPIENMGISASGDRSSSIEFWVKKEARGNIDEQILFESNKGAIKAVQKETGKVGFSREEYDYSFNYTLPENE